MKPLPGDVPGSASVRRLREIEQAARAVLGEIGLDHYVPAALYAAADRLWQALQRDDDERG